jgi:hypothetical protein
VEGSNAASHEKGIYGLLSQGGRYRHRRGYGKKRSTQKENTRERREKTSTTTTRTTTAIEASTSTGHFESRKKRFKRRVGFYLGSKRRKYDQSSHRAKTAGRLEKKLKPL